MSLKRCQVYLWINDMNMSTINTPDVIVCVCAHSGAGGLHVADNMHEVLQYMWSNLTAYSVVWPLIWFRTSENLKC